jgi:beta-glucosidase
MKRIHRSGLICALVLGAAAIAVAQPAQTWRNPKLSPDRRADLLLQHMSLDEQIALLHGHFPVIMRPPPTGVPASAGWIPGQPKYGLPDVHESDASLGVANAGRGDKDDAAPLPSGLLLASTFSPQLAFDGGAMIGKEARQKGFNVLLSGGANLARDPRNGRNFEYLGEDPLLGGLLDGASIRGIQSAQIVSTAKHYALNDQETARGSLSAVIGEAAMRESDLLEFEIAIKSGRPGAIMCAYNRINGTYACENPHILTDVLKRDWGYPGWVMSDWGAVHSVDAATAGLDQESGQEADRQVFFDAPLKAAVKDGRIPAAKVRDMAHRVLRSLFAEGVVDHPLAPGGLDTAGDSHVSGRVAEQGIVLLKNSPGLLPLAVGSKRIAVIGGHADVGVISGGGSSQVIPVGSVRFPSPKGAPSWGGGVIFHPSSPLKAIRARAGGEVAFADGSDPAAAAAAARGADVAVVFATQWSTEAMDIRMKLDDEQDALIEAVAAANPHTIVVLETGGPVVMPWLDKVSGVLEAWYPGAEGGEAIAKVLFGETNPSGRLPITFPTGEDQLPRPELSGYKDARPEGQTMTQGAFLQVHYDEGSDVGYRWFAAKGLKPLYPFGYGLSYTDFRYAGLKTTGGQGLSVSFTVTNTGRRAGIETPQLYLSRGPHRSQQRLIAFSRVALKPGESRRITLTADPRLLADWSEAGGRWKRAAGRYEVFVGPNATDPVLTGAATLTAASLAP